MNETIYGIISVLLIIMPFIALFIILSVYAKIDYRIYKGYISDEEINEKFAILGIIAFVTVVIEAILIAVLIKPLW